MKLTKAKKQFSDKLSICLSVCCILHCIALPFLILLIPSVASLWINDESVESLNSLDTLRDSVTEALNDVVNLTSKLTNSQKILPDKLPNNPMELSFWIGAHLGGPVAEEQQKLLEERNTYTRLQREFEMLDHTRKQLAARTALKESFPDIKDKDN